MMEFLQRFDDQEIHREPHRAAPVRIPAEQSRIGFAGSVSDFKRAPVNMKDIWIVQMESRKSANPKGREKFGLVEHPPKEAFHTMSTQEREKPAFAKSRLEPSGNK